MVSKVDFGKKQSMLEISFRTPTSHKMVMKVSLKVLQKQQTSFGEDFRNYRKKKEQRAAYLTWKQKLLPVLQHMVLDI